MASFNMRDETATHMECSIMRKDTAGTQIE